jgi:signal peptidase I
VSLFLPAGGYAKILAIVTTRRPVDELAIQVLRRDGHLRIKARGSSMMPFIRDGDVVVVTTTESTEVGVGDVICYERPPGRLFLHRIIGRDGDGFVAKGDALAFTELVERAHVLGKVITVERHGRGRRLDSRTARWRNRAIAFLSPWLPRLLSLALGVRRVWGAAFRG